MSDSYTNVESVGWFSRIGNSLKGILVGMILVVIGLGLLWFNEGRSVKRAKALEEGRGGTVTLDSIDKVVSEMEGKLVHAVGLATGESLRDPVFPVEAKALSLRRDVEMYQYVESKTTREEKKAGGGVDKHVTYSYDLQWRDDWVDSKKFDTPEGHENPRMPVKGVTTSAAKVAFGAFALPNSLVGKIKGKQKISPTDEALEAAGQYHDSPKIDDGQIYLGEDPGSPGHGDIRISFSMVPEATVSIVSAQKGETFEPFITSNKGKLNLLAMGEKTVDEMYDKAEADNVALTWGLRAGGFVLTLIGFTLILGPLSVLADVIPLIGSIVGGVTFVVSFFMSAGLSSLVIAVSWIAFRPMVGIPLLVVTLGSFIALIFVRKKK